MGISIPKTQVIWASPSHYNLVICVRVRVTGDTHITRVLEMAMSKTRGSHIIVTAPLSFCMGKVVGTRLPLIKEVS